MEDTKLIAKKRDLEGSGNARRMRHAGALPAVVYGGEKEAVSVEVNAHDFERILHHSASESILVDISLEGEGDISVLVKEVQHHPVTSDLLHVDLLRIAANKPIHVDVSIELVGDAEGVKAGGSLDHTMHSVGVECLPGDLVEFFEVDVSEMKIGSVLRVSDIKLDSKFKLLIDDEAIVASIHGPQADEDDEDGADGSAEPEVITEKKVEE